MCFSTNKTAPFYKFIMLFVCFLKLLLIIMSWILIISNPSSFFFPLPRLATLRYKTFIKNYLALQRGKTEHVSADR